MVGVQRIMSETSEERHERLHQMRLNRWRWLAIETSKAREAHIYTHPGQQLASETPVDRETRQQQMNICQQQRLDAEMPEERFQQDMKLHKE